MYTLSDEQIDYIAEDIKSTGVEIEDLQDNLLDHICCIIERELREGDDFEHFYRQTIKQFYVKDLKEIEEETINLLTFKNYYAMKKVMLYSGALSTLVLFVGALFKIARWPGAGILLFTGLLLFSLVFLPIVFLFKTKNAETKREKLVIGAGTLAGILYFLSALFIMMHWPGARELWVGTLSVSFFVLLPLYFFTGIRKAETKLNTIVTTVILMGVLAIQFTMTPVKREKQLHDMAQQTEQMSDK